MTVSGMDISKLAPGLHGQSSPTASNTGTKPALDFAALISMISNGQDQGIVNAEGVDTSLTGDVSVSTEELVKKMLSSVILSDENIPELSESEVNTLSENRNLTEFAEIFLDFLSQKSEGRDFRSPATEYAHLQNYGNFDISRGEYQFSMSDDPSLISSGSNLLLNLLMKDLKQANDPYLAGKIQTTLPSQNTVPSIVDKIWNTSVLSDTNSKILSINYESVIEDLNVNDDNVAHFVKVYAANSKFLEGSSYSSQEPKILNLQVNAKFSNDTDALETKVNVIDEKATSFRLQNFVPVFDRGAENNTIILNIKNVDAVVAQFKLELDGQSSLPSDRVNDLAIVLHQGGISDHEVAEISLSVLKDKNAPLQFDRFVDSDHAVIFERSSLPKEISERNVDSYVTLKFVKNDLTLDDDGVKRVNFTKLDQLGSISEEFLQKLSDVQSGKFGAKYMNETLGSDLVDHNSANLKLDQLKTPFSNFIFELSKKPSVNLKISTADILSYRNIITKPSKQRININASNEKILLPNSNEKIFLTDSNEKISLLDPEKTFLPDNLERPFDQNIKFDAPKPRMTSEAYLPNSNFVNFNDIGTSLNRVMPTQGPSGSIVNSLSLYDAQYSSRLGMLITENIIKGQENFDIQLEPESFGKVRVSVSMENANVEVKMLAENSAAIMALRSSEAILQSITEQNGLKLSDYSVDMQNNASNGERQGKNEKDNNLLDSSRYSDKEVASDDILTNSETSHSLNLLA